LHIRSLRVRGWRNLADESLPLASRVTVLFGQNGQGKSNLLEAAYYAVTFRSFRTNSAADLVMWGAVGADVEAALAAYDPAGRTDSIVKVLDHAVLRIYPDGAIETLTQDVYHARDLQACETLGELRLPGVVAGSGTM